MVIIFYCLGQIYVMIKVKENYHPTFSTYLLHFVDNDGENFTLYTPLYSGYLSIADRGHLS